RKTPFGRNLGDGLSAEYDGLRRKDNGRRRRSYGTRLSCPRIRIVRATRSVSRIKRIGRITIHGSANKAGNASREAGNSHRRPAEVSPPADKPARIRDNIEHAPHAVRPGQEVKPKRPLRETSS